MMQVRRRRRKLHAFNKKNSFNLLRYAHYLLHFTKLLCYTFYVICYLSLYFCLSFLLFFLCKFIVFFTKFVLSFVRAHFFPLFFVLPRCVFSCQYYASTHLFHFQNLKLLIILLKWVILLVYVFSIKSSFVQNL